MVSEIHIQSFKSIRNLTLRPGRVTVLIGENGGGKSNVLEGIAFAACAAADKLDNEFLYHRGIRVTDDTQMVSAFPLTETDVNHKRRIEFRLKGGEDDGVFHCRVVPKRRKDDSSFLGWRVIAPVNKTDVNQALHDKQFREGVSPALREFWKQVDLEQKVKRQRMDKGLREAVENNLQSLVVNLQIEIGAKKRKRLMELARNLSLADFIIYAPEYSALRASGVEDAIQPLGTNGQGLFRLLRSFENEKFKDRLADLQARLHVFGWFDKFVLPDDSAIAQMAQLRLQIYDRWFAKDNAMFDERSANEGFLFVLFYFTLLLSWRTPRFFAIDNIDTALNPRLCSILLQQIVELAKKYDKQLICTTHNPAILDGLNLNDDEQRLYTVLRDSQGHTVVRRVRAPEPQIPGELPIRLSEAFVRGLIGGLPENF